MKLATWAKDGTTTFGVIGDDGAVFDLGRRSNGMFADLMAVIRADATDAVAKLAKGPPDGHVSEVSLLPPLTRPGKIICVGVNYPERNAEYKDGSAVPKFPSLFIRFPASLVGHDTPILRPPESAQFDYEGEIVIVVGKAGRRIAEADAHGHIFGLTLMNEGSVRDWLRHGKFNVTQGKNFERSGAVGPWIVPLSPALDLANLTVVTRVNGEERQRGNTGTLMFSFELLQLRTYDGAVF